MKTIKFSGFQVAVPENDNEVFSTFGKPPKAVTNMVKILNNKKFIPEGAIVVANMIKREIKQNYIEII